MKERINQFEHEIKKKSDVIQKFTCLLKLRHKQTLQWINKDIYQLMKKLDHALKKITAHKIAYRGYKTRL